MNEYLRFDIIKNWYSANESYVSKVETLLEGYFDPDKLGNNGYINIGEYKYKEAGKFTPKSKSQIPILEPIDINAPYPSGFSGYEKILFSNIFYGGMDTYVISGPMGSGKTTSIRHIMKKGLELSSLKDTVDIYLDFNQGFTSHDMESLLDEFYEKLYSKLKVEIIENVFKFDLTTKFLNHIQKNYANFSRFYDFSFDNLYLEYKNWDDLDAKQKLRHVFKYIQKYTERYETRVDMTMKFINFMNKFLKAKDILLIITYDNIDKLVPTAQRNIMSKILAFNKIAKTKKIITIRRSTKAKLDKILKRSEKRLGLLGNNRSQTVYGHIYHHGPSPTRVYITRLKELLDDIDDSVYFDALTLAEKEAVKLRTKSILHYFDQGNSFLKQAFYCLTGESNRLGLTIGNRPFANYFNPYDKEPLNQQQLIQGLYVGSEPSLRMSPTDDYVANLLANDDNYQFTLINYYLLSIVKQSGQLAKPFRISSYIYDILYDAFDYSDEEIIDSFNFLMDDRRALIGGEYRPMYKDSDELFRLDDKIRITELGDRYYEGLLMQGTRYLQESFLSLKWPRQQNIQTFEYTVSGRFHALRSCLYEIQAEDEFRMNTYQYNIESYEAHPFKFFRMEHHLLGHFAKSLIFVTQGMKNLSFHLQTELEAWIDYLERIDTDDFYKEIRTLKSILRKQVSA